MLNKSLHSPYLIRYLLLITLLAHSIPAAFVPLTVDEAHYALYGLKPALSYFDHPPLVGWLNALALMISDHEFALRSFAIASYALSLWLVYRYTLTHYQSQITANIATLLFSAMPILHLLGIGLVPDTLLLPLTIALFWQAQNTLTKPSWQNWLLLGLLIGTAALSKYTSILFAVGLVFMLLVSKSTHLFKHPGLWMSVAIAGTMTLPILIWNSQHNWISILYQLNHGSPDTAFMWTHLLQSQASQLLAYTPFVWLGAWLLTTNFRQFISNIQHRQLVAFTLPALIIFTISSGKEPSLPHWLAFFYLLWLPSLSQRITQAYHASNRRLVNIVFTTNFTYGWLITLVIIALSFSPRLGEAFHPNPAQDLMGWKTAAQIATEIRLENEPILTTHWVDSSRIAWYARPAPVIVLDDRIDQFDLWFGSPTNQTSGLLILPPHTNSTAWLARFESCQYLTATHEDFRFYRCLHFIVSP